MITKNKIEFYTGDVRFSTCVKGKGLIEEFRSLKNVKNVVLAKVKGKSTFILVKEVLKDPFLQEQIVNLKNGRSVLNVEDFIRIKHVSDIFRAGEYYVENVALIENPNKTQQAQINAFLDLSFPQNGIGKFLNKKLNPTIDDIIIK